MRSAIRLVSLAAVALAIQAADLRVLLVSGWYDHSFLNVRPVLENLLAERFQVKVTEELEASQLSSADALVLLYNGPRWARETEAAVERWLASGKGMVTIHGATYAFGGVEVREVKFERSGIIEPPWEQFVQMIGCQWPEEKLGHGKRHSFRVDLIDREHPITRGLGDSVMADDELYHRITVLPHAKVLATAYSHPDTRGTGKKEPMLWTTEYGKGRVVHTTLGHDAKAMRQTGFAQFVTRGVEWAATAKVASPPVSQRYRNPIVFCRALLDDGGKVVRNSKLWVMEEDGSNLRQLTFGPSYDDHPSFYSDQRHVLYSEFAGPTLNRDTEAKLIRLDIYTGEREVVLHNRGFALHHASISPLGDDLIVYHKDTRKRHSEWGRLPPDTYELNAPASNGVFVSENAIVTMHEKNRGYSPREVSLARVEGHGPDVKITMLTDEKHLHRRAAVSPDGRRLAWQTNAAGGEDEIFLAGIDASNPRNLTKLPGNDGHPWFSRDGEWIVYESDRDAPMIGKRKGMEIWKVNVKTGQSIQLTFGGKKFISNRPRM